MNLPEDLYELSYKARKCFSCHEIWSDLSACLYCGYTVCKRCDEAKDKHKIEVHLGSIARLELATGDVTYESEKGLMQSLNLFKNFADESYVAEHCKRPKKDYFHLNARNHEKILEDILLEKITDRL